MQYSIPIQYWFWQPVELVRYQNNEHYKFIMTCTVRYHSHKEKKGKLSCKRLALTSFIKWIANTTKKIHTCWKKKEEVQILMICSCETQMNYLKSPNTLRSSKIWYATWSWNPSPCKCHQMFALQQWRQTLNKQYGIPESLSYASSQL